MLTLTDLPRIMQEREHWPVAAACMRRWLQNGASQISEDARRGATHMSALPTKQLETRLLQINWALSFPWVKIVHDTLITKTWRNPASQRRMIQLAQTLSKTSPARATLSGGWAFGDPSAAVKDLDATAQINYAVVGDPSDPLDDFYGAVGRGELKVAAFGRVEPRSKGLRLTVDRLGVYLRDTYDFNGEQWLGLWSETGVDKGRLAEAWGMYIGGYPSISIEPTGVRGDAKTEYAVANKDFRAYRAKYGRGGDFINVSNIRLVTLAEPASFDLP